MSKYDQDKQKRLNAWRSTLDQDNAGQGAKQPRMVLLGRIFTVFDEDGNRSRIVPPWFVY